MKKKILGLLLIVAFAMTFVACNFNGGEITINPGGNTDITKVDLDDVFLNIESQIKNKDAITEDITLPTKFGSSVTISWLSDNANIIDNSGHITRPEEDTEVLLRCTITGPTESKVYEIRVTIKAKEIVIDPVVTVDTIANVIKAEVGNSYKTKGVVVAVCKTGFIIKDATGLILSYLDTYANDLVIGDVVEVEGTTTLYGGAVQFNKPTYTKVSDEQVTYPTPRALDKDSYEALLSDSVTLEYVSLRAKLAISGKYYNLNVDDSTIKGSMCAPVIDVNDFDGKYVDLVGYFVYISGSATKYLYFMVTDIKLSDDQGGGETPIELTLSTIAEVKAGTVGEKYKAKAVVVAVSSVSVLVQDETGYILLYFGNDFRKDLAVGDEIDIEGTTSEYRGTIQFSSGKYEKVGTKTVSYPEAEVIDAISLDALVDQTPVTKYVKVEGKLVKSGNYINLEVAGATAMGSVLALDDLSSLDGKNVVVTGFYLYVTGSTTKYVYFIMTNIEESTTPVEHVVAKLDSDKQGTYKGGDVTVVVFESKVTVTDPTGKVLEFIIYVEDDKYYILEEGTKVYCTFGDGTVTNDKGTFTKVTIETPVSTINEVKVGTVGENYKVKAVVVAVSNVSVLLQDETGLILVYFGSSYAKDLVIGDEIEIEGKTTTYSSTVQFNGGTYSKVGTKAVSYPEARVLDASGLDKLASAAPAIEFIKVEGKLVKSGNYVNLEVAGATAKGSVVTAADVTSLDGKNVVVTGYFLYVTGSSTKYINFIATDIQENTVAPTYTVAKLDSEKQGTYKGGDVTVVVFESKVTVTDPTGKVLEYVIYVEDGKYFVLDNGEKDYCTFGEGTVTNSKGTFTKVPDTPIFNTIEEVKAGTVGNTYKVKATVVAESSVSVLLQDETGLILVYFGSSYNKDLLVGDEIEIEGSTTTYSNTIQFNGGTYSKVGTKTVSYPEPEVLDVNGFNALAEMLPVIKYIQVEGKLVISGNYINLEVEGATFKGSVIVPRIALSDYANKMVVVTGYFLYISGSSTKYISILTTDVKETENVTPELPLSTISEVFAGTVGNTYKAQGVVVAKTTSNALIKDETGYIVLNFGSGYDYAKLTLGSLIEVEGVSYAYGKTIEFNRPTYKVISETTEVLYQEPRLLETNEDILALNTEEVTAEYVKFTAKLIQSGKYYNLDFGSETVCGSLAYPIDSLTDYVDKDVVITGYFVYISSSSSGVSYLNFMYTDIALKEEGSDLSDEELVDRALADYAETFAEFAVVGSLVLPSEYTGGVRLTWVSSNEAVLASDGTYTAPLEDTDVTFTLTASKGEITKSCEILIHVKSFDKVDDILSSNNYDTIYTTKGVVVATLKQGFLVKDETGEILVYIGDNYKADLQVGDEVVVKGTINNYGGVNQFEGIVIYSKTGNTLEVTYPTPYELETEDVEALFETIDSQYCKFSGILSVTEYLNLVSLENTDIIANLYANDISAFDGKAVEVEGYYHCTIYGVQKYLIFIVTSIKEDTTVDVDKIAVKNVITNLKYLYDNIEIVDKLTIDPVENVTISWIVNDNNPITDDLVVINQERDCACDIVFTVISGDYSEDVSIHVYIKGYITVDEALASEVHYKYAVKGTVVAKSAVSFLLKGESGYLLVYGKEAGFDDVEVGQVLIVKGILGLYSNMRQLSDYIIIDTEATEEVVYPMPVELYGNSADKLLDSPSIQYVKVTGTLVINGYYYNLTIAESTNKFSIVSPLQDLSEYNGETIAITGYYIYTAGSDKYITLLMTSYEVLNLSDEELVKEYKDYLESLNGIELVSGLAFSAGDDGVELVWSSDHKDIIDDDLSYNYPEVDTNVTLTITITKGEATAVATVTFVCKAPVAISTVLEATDLSNRFLVKATVVATTEKTFLISDGTGMLYVFYGDTYEQDLVVGDEVYVRGYVSDYNGIREFSKNIGYTKTGITNDVTYPEAEVLDGAGFDALTGTPGYKYIKVTGDFALEDNYYNIYVVGANNPGSLIYPKFDNALELNGERLVLTGYYCYTAGSRYLNIIVVDYEYYEWTDAEIVQETKAFLESVDGTTVLAGIGFTFASGVEVTWQSSHENILSSEFVYNVPEVDTIVTLTATITKGEVTDTASFTLLCKGPQAISTVLEATDLSDRFLVKGTVVAVSQVSFLVQDETGLILAYYGNEFPQDLEVGDVVYLRGYAYDYSGIRQIGKNVGYTKTGEKVDVSYPEPITLDASSFDELLDSTEIKFVKLTATLHVSGNYYNLAVEGSSNNGSIVYPTDANLSLADGATVSLTGYYLYTSGSETKYISFIATSLNYEVSSAGE